MFAAPAVLIAVVAMQTPADTVRYQVVNHGRHAGTMDVVTVADTIVVHLYKWDRGNETNTTTRYVTDEAGTIVRLEAHRGDAPDPVERYTLADRGARWRTSVDSGTTAVDGPAFYWPRLYNEFNSARLAVFLLDQPQQTADLLPFHAPAVDANDVSRSKRLHREPFLLLCGREEDVLIKGTLPAKIEVVNPHAIDVHPAILAGR